ncbi:hypothetical protein BC936DRAFT_140363 [Jimgerdemannia flammicorona]|uniref:Uncharacterized protein n=1 Tax=Jimgerdemannia flammicorona TaxID=994334 RepID=A0A433DGV4_9FUNG|nr:hypothetical protein BC936DRAFT_140363 [Jimgerdemannia flammicorona]
MTTLVPCYLVTMTTSLHTSLSDLFLARYVLIKMYAGHLTTTSIATRDHPRNVDSIRGISIGTTLATFTFFKG